MQRLFPGFPSGLPGSGLLLLRIAFAAHLMMVGGRALAQNGRGDIAPAAATIGVVWIGCALLVALGALTPFVQVSVAVTIGGASLLGLPAHEATAAAEFQWLVVAIASSLAMLGPGAYSVDAYLFGRREISIPPLPVQPPNDH